MALQAVQEEVESLRRDINILKKVVAEKEQEMLVGTTATSNTKVMYLFKDAKLLQTVIQAKPSYEMDIKVDILDLRHTIFVCWWKIL